MQLNCLSLHTLQFASSHQAAVESNLQPVKERTALMTEKEAFLNIHARECKTTHNLLKAFPADKLDLRPHEKSRSARELAFVLANQELFYKLAAEGELDPTSPAKPQPPATMEEIIQVLEKNHKAVDEALAKASDDDLNQMLNFAGQTMRRLDALWANQFDSIHHRGQFSVYLRMAGAKVPSIYGPTADTPAAQAAA
jgi:uncharacterized damage-inducible protein DinB